MAHGQNACQSGHSLFASLKENPVLNRSSDHQKYPVGCNKSDAWTDLLMNMMLSGSTCL